MDYGPPRANTHSYFPFPARGGYNPSLASTSSPWTLRRATQTLQLTTMQLTTVQPRATQTLQLTTMHLTTVQLVPQLEPQLEQLVPQLELQQRALKPQALQQVTTRTLQLCADADYDREV